MLKRAHWFGVGGIALIAPLLAVLHPGCQPTCQVDSDCPSSTFCFIGPGQCAQAVPLGFCTDISDVCSPAAVPVCGCDNVTYTNACEASQKGHATATMAACIALPCGGTAGDCPTGQVCQYPMIGTCAGQGITGSCVTPMTSCGDTDQPVCGCDGKTYANLCEMQKHGTSEYAAVACPCQDNSQCASDAGAQYCALTTVGACLLGNPMGTCAPVPPSCSPVQSPVCGCNGKTYPNGCIASQAGVNVATAAACMAGMLPDAGADGGDGG